MVRKLRVAIDSTFVRSNYVTGIERYTVESIKALFALNHDDKMILLAHPIGIRNFPNIPSSWDVVISPIKNRIIMDQIWLPGILKKLSVDWVHYNTMGIPAVLSTPFSLTIHDAVPVAFPDTISTGNKWYYKPLQRKALRSQLLGGVITVSHFSASEIKKWMSVPEDKIRVVPEGISSSLLEASPADVPIKNPYFLIVGTLEPRKNLQVVLEAFECVADNIQTDLVIVGRNGWGIHTKLSPTIRNRVHFTGYISDNELAGYYKNAIALIFPSIYEGFGLPLLEAAAFNTPIIASDISVFHEVGEGICEFFNPYDSLALSQILEKYESSNSLQTATAEESRQLLRRYSWQNNARCLVESIKSFQSRTL